MISKGLPRKEIPTNSCLKKYDAKEAFIKQNQNSTSVFERQDLKNVTTLETQVNKSNTPQDVIISDNLSGRSSSGGIENLMNPFYNGNMASFRETKIVKSNTKGRNNHHSR